MIDKDLLSKITILIVEDSKTIRETMHKALEKYFHEIIVAVDGEDGLDKFKTRKNIDIIISDIKMPKMSGIEMLQEIRKIDNEIPVILTTAYTQTDFLLNAIENDVMYYAVKPINIKKIISQIYSLIKIKFEKIYKEKEIQQYVDIVDQVAIISKTNEKGIITYVNKIFCEVSGYTEDELIGKNHNIVRHPDMSSNIFENLWSNIQNGKTWHGKIKNQAKDGSAYFVQATIFPIYNDTGTKIISYMGIRFLTTQEELEKRDFKKKIIQNFQQTKQTNKNALEEIECLKKKLSQHKHFDLIQDALESEKKRSSKFHTQILYYEEKIDSVEKNLEETVSCSNQKVDKAFRFASEAKKKIEQAIKEKAFLENDLKEKKVKIENLNHQVIEQSKIIRDLRDVINHREEQLGIN